MSVTHGEVLSLDITMFYDETWRDTCIAVLQKSQDDTVVFFLCVNFDTILIFFAT